MTKNYLNIWEPHFQSQYKNLETLSHNPTETCHWKEGHQKPSIDLEGADKKECVSWIIYSDLVFVSQDWGTGTGQW